MPPPSPPLQDTVTGFLLAGVGHVDLRRSSNFFIVNESE
jgi:vacuolar-type H+-ATPase subunit F/Vma7